jgi:hypothetical protein
MDYFKTIKAEVKLVVLQYHIKSIDFENMKVTLD